MQRVRDFLDTLSYPQLKRLGLLLAISPIFLLIPAQTWLLHSIFGDIFSLLGYGLLFASLSISRRMHERKNTAMGIARKERSWLPWVIGSILGVIMVYVMLVLYLRFALAVPLWVRP